MKFNPFKIVGTSHHTNTWLDLYTVARQTSLDWVMEHRDETRLEIRIQDQRYRELTAAWDRVRKRLQIFGLELDENEMQMWPDPNEVTVNQRVTNEWLAKPELKLWRTLDITPLHFTGNEAVVALAFLNFFVHSVKQFDPQARVRELLAKQGIDKTNFKQYEQKLNIQNPFT